jgi:hypothetical protein
MAASFGEIHIVNTYATSGTSKRRERENFFNNELPYILDMASADILLGGDFNCVRRKGLHWARLVQPLSKHRSLSTLIYDYSLRDAWQARPGNTAYTHYAVHGDTRLDHFYLTEGLLRRKTGVETIAAAYAHHFAVVLRLSMGAPLLLRGRGTWKLRTDILTSTHVMQDLQHHWTQWKNRKYISRHKLVVVSSLQEAAPTDISALGGGRRRDLQTLENFC